MEIGKIIDEGLVPEKCIIRKIDWNIFFSGIPVGMAFECNVKDLNYGTVRSALKRLKKRGLYKNYFVVRRKDLLYVVNPSGGDL